MKNCQNHDLWDYKDYQDSIPIILQIMKITVQTIEHH
jgi:hypothetical protein